MRSHIRVTLTLAALAAAGACADGPAAPAAPDVASWPVPRISGTGSPSAGGTLTYDFEDISAVTLGTTYGYLAFEGDPAGGSTASVSPDPFLSDHGQVLLTQNSDERIDLGGAASQVSVEYQQLTAPTLTAYDASGAVIATATGVVNLPPFDPSAPLPPPTWSTLTVSGTGIASIGLTGVGPFGLSAGGTFDNLAVTYEAPVGPADPAGKDACKKGGWEAFGFKNQGQCVRFIETGKDSRTPPGEIQ